ncbi:MAG TPA: hypothetical protein V6D47_02570 [Oscillatoriaceae cyanobacterium]
MFDSLQSQLGKLLGKRDDDPQSTITADQLKVVLKSIEGKYNNLKNENKLFKSKIEEQKASIAELTQTVSELRGGAAQGESQLVAELQSDLEAARAQLESQGQGTESLRNEKLQLQSKLSVQEALVSSLRHELSELREGQAAGPSPEEHAKAIADRDRLKSENTNLQAKVQELAGKLVELEEAAEEGASAREQVGTLQSDLLTAKTDLKTAKQAVKKLESERNALMERLEKIADEEEDVNDKLEAASKAREEAETAKEALEAVAEDLKNQVAKAREAQKQLDLDKDELRHQVQKQQAEIRRLEEQIATGGGAQGEVFAALEQRYLEAKAKLDQMGSENQALQARMQALLDEPAHLGAREKTEFEFTIRRLTDELREASLQISSLRESKVKANLDLEEAATELVELRRQVDEMRRDRNFYRERWESLREGQGEVDALKDQMRGMMQEIGRLRGGSPEPARPAPMREAPRAPQPVPQPAAKAEPAQPTVEVSSGHMARRREMLNKLIGDRKNP